MTDPLVSIIVPTYNRPDLLKRALWCIKEQTFTDYEVIVVNDAGQSIEEVQAEYPDHYYIIHTKNQGLAAARNTGIKAARGKYITYQDDDDIWFPEHLQILVEHLESLPHIRAAYTDCYQWFEERYLFIRSQKGGTFGKPGNKVVAIICLMHEREILEDVGMFDAEMRCMEDWDFIIRMNRKYNILHVPLFTAGYSKRLDVDQLSTNEGKMKEAYDIIQERYGITPPKYQTATPPHKAGHGLGIDGLPVGEKRGGCNHAHPPM